MADRDTLENEAAEVRRAMCSVPAAFRERLSRRLTDIERRISDTRRMVRIGDHDGEEWTWND